MYFLITFIRNLLFKHHIMKSRKYDDVFVLCVGNLRVGGTGKTPMIEYLIKHLMTEFPLAVISLGYKRKTKGLKEVLLNDTTEEVGDEPKQMKEKFPEIKFFVNKDRNEAINNIRSNHKEIKLILLDDAYQYRKTTPNATILLTEYNRPYFQDFVLPYGRLRESKAQSKRADYIVVTKTPNNVSAESKQNFIKHLKATSKQQVFFSKIIYNLPKIENKNLLFVAGIDNPYPAVRFLEENGFNVLLEKFSDHYQFKDSDISRIVSISKQENRQIITTEKDFMRLKRFKGISFEVLKIENEIDNNFLNILKNDLRANIRS